jgi:hypothetical protein
MADVRKILIEIDAKTGNVVGGIASVNKQLSQLGATAKITTKEVDKAAEALQKKMAGSAGIAGAAATELGRTISDLPFGISAVTNNISQLGNMFALLVTSAGGFKNALTALKTTLMGPVGILVAFQAVVAGVEFFAQSQRKAKKETEEATVAFNEQAVAIENLIASYDINKLVSELDFLVGDKGVGKNVDDLKKRLNDVVNFLIKKSPEFKEAFENLTPQEQNDTEMLKALVTEFGNIIRVKNIIRNLNKQLEQEGLTENEIADIQSKIVDAELSLMNRVQNFKTRMTQEFDTPIDTFYNFGKDMFFEIDKGFEDALKKKGENFLSKLRGISSITEVFEPEPYFPFIDPNDVEMEAEIDDYFKKLKDKFDKKQKDLAKSIETIDLFTRGLSAINDVLNAQAERELTIEQNKTTKLNDQLRIRLANEQLSADQRDLINQQISRNEAELVEVQNQIARKQFKRDKAFKIVMALGDTASSALKAYASQLLPFDPTSIGRATVAAKIAAAFGLAQVAALSRLKYQEQALPSPNLSSVGGGGGAGGGEPTFNVVGAAGNNQLAAAIASTQNQPVKAFVVASDVTTAQQLDRNIISSASI